MQKIDSAISLRDAIQQLEVKQTDQGSLLKEQFHLAYESMMPINLIKNTFKQAATSQEIKADILSVSVGLAAGYLSQKLNESTSQSPIEKLLGSTLLFGITYMVAKNPEAVKTVSKGFLDIIISQFDGSDKVEESNVTEPATCG